MKKTITKKLTISVLGALATCLVLQACDKKTPLAETAAAPAAPSVAPVVAPTPAAPPTETAAPTQPAMSSAELEELLAPIALYPDGVLAQVLASSTKPQEVLDGGNWLLENDDLKGKALEEAAKNAGFTPSMIALMQFPDVVDMMCMKMNWTTELGEAFLADEPAVLAAVQSLRKKAAAMGNLQSSTQLKVENQTVNNQEVIAVTSPDPKVVYVPQYDPVTTYTTPAPTATATSTTVTESSGHSTAALITTGLLAFGAGILVNEAFDDDDDDHYYPYWGGGARYYPAPYYPVYGNGFHPSHKYNNSFNNNNVIINTGKNDYWKRFDGDRPHRDNAEQPWKGKNDYAGAKPGMREKIDREQADRERKKLAANNAIPATREVAKNRSAVDSDRGRAGNNIERQQPAARIPDRQIPDRKITDKKMPDRKVEGGKQNAFQGARDNGNRERAASQRGKASVQRQGGQAKQGGNRAGGRKK